MNNCITFILVMLVLAVPVFAFWSGSVQDQIISQDDSLQGWFSRIAVDRHGAIHVVWNERVTEPSAHQEIHYSRSIDNGRTWLATDQDIVISYNDDMDAENGSSIAIDSQNRIYVVWAERDHNSKEIHYSTSSDCGKYWSGRRSDHVLSYLGGPDAYSPQVAIDSNDIVHVVWNQDWQNGIDEIYYAYSINRGTLWSSQIQERIISYPDSGLSSYPDLAVGPNNILVAVWREPDNINRSQVVANVSISTDGGTTWSGTTSDQPVTQPFYTISDPQVVIDQNGIIHVVWQGTLDEVAPIHYEIYYSRSTDGGTTWSGTLANHRISYWGVGEQSAFNANLGIDHCGNLFAVWDEEYNGATNEIHISVSTDAGISWSGETHDEIISFPDGNSAFRPFIAAGVDDTLHVTWNERTTGIAYQIHYSRGDAICIPVLPQVDRLTITIIDNNVILRWNPVPQAIGYKIYRSNNPKFIPTQQDLVGYTNLNSWVIPDIRTDNSAMFFRIKAVK
jgi:hypothetical protein